MSEPLPRQSTPRYVDGVAIWRVPEEDTGRILIREHWAVDNRRETSTFDTRDECVKFARARWGWRGV